MPDDADALTAYNYADFVGQGDFDPDEWARLPRAGTRAPDCTLIDLDTGAPVALSTLWRSSHVVLELGSYT